MKFLLFFTSIILFNLSARAEFILNSSDIVFSTARFAKNLDNGSQIKIFPAEINLVEVDDKSGAVRQTKIVLELNQLKTPKVNAMIGDDPEAVPGPWLMLGLGTGVSSMKIQGLPGHTLAELLDTPFSGQLIAYGFGYVKRHLNISNSNGIYIVDTSSKGVGYQNSGIKLTLSSQNAKVKMTFAGRTEEYTMSIDDLKSYRYK